VKAELIDNMGSDLTVVNAARVSFDKESEWEYCDFDGQACSDKCERDGFPCPSLNPKDQKLVEFLARNGHWTPFSHCTITLRETVPIFVARQRFKHTVGFSYNEVSRRYVDDDPEFYYPESWRKRADDKKQGSSDEVVDLKELFSSTISDDSGGMYFDLDSQYAWVKHFTICLYKDLLHAGVCPEQARMVLPQSMYTSYYVTGSLAAWSRAYKLRSDPHAQKEIQELAAQWNSIIEPLYPHSWKALNV
jgi:thymidylate synthase (FAD)